MPIAATDTAVRVPRSSRGTSVSRARPTMIETRCVSGGSRPPIGSCAMADSDVRETKDHGVDGQHRDRNRSRLSNGQETDPSVDNG